MKFKVEVGNYEVMESNFILMDQNETEVIIYLKMDKVSMRKKLELEDLSIYFIRDEQDVARCEEIKLDDEGNFMDASAEFLDFFSSDYQDIVMMDEYKAEKRRRERGFNTTEDSN